MPTADNNRRRQLPRVVRQTLLDATKHSIARSKMGTMNQNDDLKRSTQPARKTATVISIANPTQVTCVGHGLVTGDVASIDGSDSNPTIDGMRTVTRIDNDNFTVTVNVVGAGTKAGVTGVNNLRTMLLRGQCAPST